jgi:hypothetical protein
LGLPARAELPPHSARTHRPPGGRAADLLAEDGRAPGGLELGHLVAEVLGVKSASEIHIRKAQSYQWPGFDANILINTTLALKPTQPQSARTNETPFWYAQAYNTLEHLRFPAVISGRNSTTGGGWRIPHSMTFDFESSRPRMGNVHLMRCAE